MSWVAVGAAAVTVIGGAISNNQSNKAAGRAARAQRDANFAAIEEQRLAREQAREDMLPFLQAGYGALDKQSAILNGDFTGFQNSPDYLFALNQGMNTLDHSAAARGGLFGGGHTKDLVRYGQGMASQNLNNYWSKLAGMAGQSFNAGANLGQMGQAAASNIGNAYNNIGNARASSYQQIGNNNAQFAAGTAGALSNLFNYYGSKNGGFGGV
jgi:hypothetical protein